MWKKVMSVTIVALVASASMVAAQNILVYDDNSNHGAAQEALTRLGLSFTLAGTTDFTSTLSGSTWDLVVMDLPSNEPVDSWQSALVAHITAGRAAIHTHWNTSSLAGLPAAFEVAVGAEKDTSAFYRWDAHPLFTAPESVPDDFTSFTDEWGSNGFFLEPTGGAEAAAGFTTSPTPNEASIVIGNSGSTIFNGFLFDDFYVADLDTDGIPDVVELIMNEVTFVTTGIQPSGRPIPALGWAGILVLVTLLAAAGVFLVRQTGIVG